MSVADLFTRDLTVVNIGLTAFKDALDDARTRAVQVDWQPPMEVDMGLMRCVREKRAEIDAANAKAMDIILRGMPHVVDMAVARDVIPGMRDDLLLHAGPPIGCRCPAGFCQPGLS